MRYEFDMIDEDLVVPPILIVFYDLALVGGHIVEYELQGPGGGAERFVVEVPKAAVAAYENTLRAHGQDPDGCRVE